MERKKIHDILDTEKKEIISIKRCVEFQNKDENRTTILAFSGGKDSVVAYMMAAKSGIKFIPMYSPTSVDPPELINYIKNEFNSWAKSKGYPEVVFKKYNTFSRHFNIFKIFIADTIYFCNFEVMIIQSSKKTFTIFLQMV